MAEQRWQIEPLGMWAPRPVTASRRSSGVFRVSWADTVRLLLDEVDKLGCDGRVVIQVDTDAADVRRDGMLRAHARVGFPGVAVSFASTHGPLTYATDAYEQQYSGTLASWQANVRAIALSLTALRAVDRYGVSRRGEQYTGWRALPASDTTAPHLTPGDAAAVLSQHSGMEWNAGDADHTRRVYRAARAATHPDRHGGDQTAWNLIEHAAGVLSLDGAR